MEDNYLFYQNFSIFIKILIMALDKEPTYLIKAIRFGILEGVLRSTFFLKNISYRFRNYILNKKCSFHSLDILKF